MPRKHVSREIRSLRDFVDDPALPALIQSLPARDLAQLCGRIGVGEAMHIMALAPAEQLVQALETSVWKIPRPGVSEVFDSRELVEWIGAWLEIGSEFTAERLARVPDDVLALYLSQIAIVATTSMWGFERSTEIGDLDRIYAPSDEETAYGPYVVSARRKEDWEIVRSALDALWADAPERLLHLCAQLSGDESMLAPQRNRESSNDDLISAREGSRERRGHVTASGARAFLALAELPLNELAAQVEYDLETRRHLSGLAVAAVEVPTAAVGPENETPTSPAADGERLAALQSALEEAGLIEAPPDRLLLAHVGMASELPIVTLLRALAENDPAAIEARGRELAYLSSVLAAGTEIDGVAPNAIDARSGVIATCNLGLEILGAHGERVRIDRAPGLVRLFLVGLGVSRTLPDRVAESFVQCFSILKKENREPLHEWLVEQAEILVADLSRAVGERDFSAAREATLALGFVFEPRACQAAVPLLGELPRLATGDGGATWIDSRAAMARALALLNTIAAKRSRRS